jgi:hypothetical protein
LPRCRAAHKGPGPLALLAFAHERQALASAPPHAQHTHVPAWRMARSRHRLGAPRPPRAAPRTCVPPAASASTALPTGPDTSALRPFTSFARSAAEYATAPPPPSAPPAAGAAAAASSPSPNSSWHQRSSASTHSAPVVRAAWRASSDCSCSSSCGGVGWCQMYQISGLGEKTRLGRCRL